jgi:hypothetical protein
VIWQNEIVLMKFFFIKSQGANLAFGNGKSKVKNATGDKGGADCIGRLYYFSLSLSFNM